MANPSRPPQNGRFYTQDDPAMDIYRDAWATLAANTHVHNPALDKYDEIYLRGIQGTYKVQLAGDVDYGFNYIMMLIWDHDRIWGFFDFGSIKGMLMVDHGPDKEPPEYRQSYDEAEGEDGGSDAEPHPIYFDFTWRGRVAMMPDSKEPEVILNNSLITKGKIELTGYEISGYFEGMPGPVDHYKFEGRPSRGPRRVPRSLSSFIDEWNDMSVFEDDVSVRLPPSNLPSRRLAKSDDPEGGQPSSKRQRTGDSKHSDENSDDGDETGIDDEVDEIDEDDEIDDDDEEDEQGLKAACQRLTGNFNIHSADIASEWPDKASSISLRLHVDQEGGKIWGRFNMGICDGYLLGESVDDIEFGQPVSFTYRGREADTGTSVRGSGIVTLGRDKSSITGLFKGMYGEKVSFEGRRILMPTGISGWETWRYQNGWEEYGNHMDHWGR